MLLLSSSVAAKDKFWISNKIEIGYDKVFVSEQVSFNRNEFIRNSLSTGIRVKLNDNTNLRTFYRLENASKHAWKNDHIVGLQLNLKLQ